jgi:hypothetical protein
VLSGKLSPTAAFMSGKLKLEGDLGKAMALDKLMGKIHSKGYHTLTTRSSFDNGVNGNSAFFSIGYGSLNFCLECYRLF